MKLYIVAEEMPYKFESFKYWHFDTLDDALHMMYNRYLKYIHTCKTSYIWLFEEVDGERNLLSSVECNPVFLDD